MNRKKTGGRQKGTPNKATEPDEPDEDRTITFQFID